MKLPIVLKVSKIPTSLKQVWLCLHCFPATSVQLDFEKEVYSVSESVGSEDLSLYVCLTADKVDRPFTVTLTPVPGTAIGI